MSGNKNLSENVAAGSKVKNLILASSILIITAMAGLLLLTLFSLSGSIKSIFTLGLILLITLLCALLFIMMRFFSSLDIINSVAKKVSQGNLNVSDIIAVKTKGLEDLTVAFNDMKSNFLSFIELTKGNIITLSDAIEQATLSIDSSCKGNEQIAESMSLVAEKAQEQLNLVKTTIEDVEASSSRIEKITENIGGIEKFIEGTVKTTEEGSRNVQNLFVEMNDISTSLDNTYQFVEKLNEEISKISEISEFIIQVSEQLKLLGLNASIEAARAGESGRGFSVVAKQIQALSSQTHESIKKIDEITVEVVKSSGDVSRSINSFINNVKESKESFDKVKESFETINKQGQVLDKDIKIIYKEINLIGDGTKEIKAKGEKLNQTSDEISSKTQNVAAVTEESLAEMLEITKQTSALGDMLANIQGLVKKFNTSVLPVEKVSRKKLKLAAISLDDNEFWQSIRRGAIYAQRELKDKNAIVDFFAFPVTGEIALEDRVLAKMKECIDNGYDGITLPGFFLKAVPLIEEAHRKSIPVMAFNCDFLTKSLRVAHFGPNNFEGGRFAANLMTKAIGSSGNIIMAVGSAEGGVHGNRRSGFLEGIKKYRNIKIVEELFTEDFADLVYSKVKESLRKNKDIQGVFVVGGGMEGAAKAIEELGLQDKVKVVGFDHTKEIFEYIKKGIIYASIGQDPFGQGHDPLIWLYNHIVTGEKLPSEAMWSRVEVVDSKNVNDLLVV
jgi:methyl-accepting chemotaxis protein/ribose transport system substrate-binding protein